MNNISKLAISSIIVFVIIIFTIMTSLSILKEEAVDNYLTISKLNAKAFSKELNQDIHNIEQTIINISSIINLNSRNETINKRLNNILVNYPQIRSINILKNQKIVYSSNNYNLNLVINNLDFFPKAIFDDNILRIARPWVGRDFISGNDTSAYEEAIEHSESFFIPISKKITTNTGEYNVIVNLNSEYFINRFLTNINTNDIIFELIRLDGILLLTSDDSKIVGKMIRREGLLEKTIEKNEITDIETINKTKYIVTYILTDNYPINLAVKLDYEKSLLSWNKKQYNFFIVTISIVIISILLALTFFYLFNKKREEEIKWHKLQIQENAKFKSLFQNSHFLSAIISSSGEILQMNNKALNFTNDTIQSIKGKMFWELKCWTKNNKNKVEELIKNHTNSRLEDELIVLDKEGNERVMDFSLSYIEIENEKILVALGLDITERKQKEEKLKQAYTVFSNTRDGIIITDKNTNLIDVNEAFEKVTGYKKEEVLNKKTNLLKSNIHDKEFYNKMWGSINKDGYWEGEITNFKKNKEEYTEWLTINTIYDNKGKVLNYIGVFSDITEQKLKEKLIGEKNYVLYQQSKMASMGEMIGNIAHQWRQPLSVISTAATGILLQREVGVSKKEDEESSLKAINEYSQYLSKTIDDFRNFLKVDKDLHLFKISKAVDEAIRLSGIKLSSNDINFILDLNHIEIYGIKNEFIQVLINLVNNSKDEFKTKKIDFKIISISANIKDKKIYIEIKDNAGGIPNDIVEKVFEPYFTTKHQSLGTGIGLYMSQEIIRNHMNGILKVENRTYTHENIEYTGACFIIELPIYDV